MSNKESKEKILDQFRLCIPYFNVLSDENRQSIIMLLAEEEEGLNVNKITEGIPLSRPAISHHLKILKQAGFVGIKKIGTENFYFLTLKKPIEEIEQLLHFIEGTCHFR
ncbi:ArsR/SmtB family transcription factor [Clostridium manihotivorum]|uniref:Transcriptional regulator n=1 Tax=Clostridium manihotivorum TaxID=2320868 RepID=A0A410DV75_9CLOT|nr:metalloregulator ArsR/SmtB family transcription factor [Clostridium manihotivorum]QAA32960.1 transcriptional regulator [Clostridium manihotivorum]